MPARIHSNAAICKAVEDGIARANLRAPSRASQVRTGSNVRVAVRQLTRCVAGSTVVPATDGLLCGYRRVDSHYEGMVPLLHLQLRNPHGPVVSCFVFQLKRSVIEAKYAESVHSMYGDATGAAQV